MLERAAARKPPTKPPGGATATPAPTFLSPDSSLWFGFRCCCPVPLLTVICLHQLRPLLQLGVLSRPYLFACRKPTHLVRAHAQPTTVSKPSLVRPLHTTS